MYIENSGQSRYQNNDENKFRGVKGAILRNYIM